VKLYAALGLAEAHSVGPLSPEQREVAAGCQARDAKPRVHVPPRTPHTSGSIDLNTANRGKLTDRR